MKIYCYYTTSYEVLANDWLKASIQDDCELIFKKDPDQGTAVNYKKEGWYNITRSKAEFVIEAIKANWNKVFIFCDPDVQFFSKIAGRVSSLIGSRDLLVQRDSPEGILCSGFFALRGNDKTLRLWQDIANSIGDLRGDDQDCLNHLMKRRQIFPFFSKRSLNPYIISWDYFPNEFLSGGTLTGKRWEPGLPLEIPENIVIHHANWTVGLQNKIAQLEYVRNIVTRRNDTQECAGSKKGTACH